MKKTLFTTLILILFISNAFSLEVNDMGGAVIMPTTTENMDVQVLQKIATLENKLVNLATKEDIETQLINFL